MPSDWWDDFFNNLATDLAPLVSLFGEFPTKQFLSESVSPIDIFIFAMAPLGIITTVVSAIRVGGSPSLRAFIGRAQEGGGNIEAELCSSTSRDVCEMYNNGGIARVFGRPKILEIVHDSHADQKDFYGLDGQKKSAGIYSFEEYITSGKGHKEWDEVMGIQNILRPWKTVQNEPESHRSLMDAVNTDFAPHPNLSLNVGIKKRSRKWFFLAAMLGFLLQSGVLVFAGLSVFAFRRRFEKDDKPTDAYAFPFTLAGTLLLCIGVGMCGHIVERSTKERIFKRNATAPDNGPRSRLFWLQPGNQVIGDQVFDPFAYNETPGSPLMEYTTSVRNTQDSELQRTNSLLVWAFVPVTIFGFILQFIGLRALHSTISIAQLGVTIFMSIIRSILRTERLRKEDNRLGDDPDLFQGHELDWLAMELYRTRLKEELKVRETEGQPQASSQLHSHTVKNRPTYIWQVATCPTHSRTTVISGEQLYACSNTKETRIVSLSIKNTAIVLLSGFRSVPKSDSSNSTYGDKEIRQWLAERQKKEGTEAPRLAPIIFLSRARTARMTGANSRLGLSRGDSNEWAEDVVPARELAATLADALQKTADALFSNYTTPPVLKDGWVNASTIFLALDCSVSELSTSGEPIHRLRNPQRDRVYVALSRASTDLGEVDGQWNIDTSEIEAILGLWMWSLRIRSRGQAKTNNSSASSKKMSLERLNSTRLISVLEAETRGVTSSNITLHQSTLNPWLGDLGTKVRRARLSYPTTPGFDPTWVWVRTVDGKKPTADQTAYTPMALHQLQDCYPTNGIEWIIGWDLFDRHTLPQQQSHWDLDALVTRTDHSPAVMCAQEIYTKLFRNLSTILEDIGGETKVMRGRHGFYLANDNITEFIKAFTDSGLGSENDARACIIPALLEKEKLPVISMLAQARDLGDEYRKEGSWKKAEEVLQWAFDTSLQSWKSCQSGSERQVHEVSTSSEDLRTITTSNKPEGELWLSVVTLCECYRWALFTGGNGSDYRQFGARGIFQMLELRKVLPHQADILEVYGKVALRVAEESNETALRKIGSQLEQVLKTQEALVSAMNAIRGLERNQVQEKNHESGQENSQEREERERQTQSLDISNDSIISAIKNGNMPEALHYLRDSSAIQEDSEGRSSLSWAAEKGWFIVVKSLIELGSKASQTDTLARTPLHFAASSGNTYLVAYLLEQGINVNSRDAEHRTPLIIAAEYGHSEILKLLMRAGAKRDVMDKHHRTPFFWAFRSGNTKAVEEFLDGGAKLNDHESYESLVGAIRCESEEMFKLSFKAGADPNTSFNLGSFEHLPTSHPLGQVIHDIHQRPWGPLTPLMIAVILMWADVCREFLQYGAKPYIKQFDCSLNAERLRFLCEKMKELGLSPERENGDFLENAIKLDCLDIVKWIVTELKVVISAKQLIRAIGYGNNAALQELLSSPNADVNGEHRLSTPMMWAVQRGLPEAVRILLRDPRVDIDLEDYHKITPFTKEHSSDILELIDQERVRRQNKLT